MTSVFPMGHYVDTDIKNPRSCFYRGGLVKTVSAAMTKSGRKN